MTTTQSAPSGMRHAAQSRPPHAAPALHRYDGAATTSVERYRWHPVDVPPPAPDPAALRGRHVVVLGGTADARAAVRHELSRSGARVTLLEDPSAGDAAAAPDDLLAATRADMSGAVSGQGAVDGIVDLGLPPGFSPHRHDLWRTALVRTTGVLQAVYDDWAAESDAQRCFYLTVTWMGGRMGYDGHGISQPLGGVWAGMAKSLPHELPACRVKVVDLAVADAPDLGRLVVAEAGDFDYYEIGYRAGMRCTLGGGADPCPPPRLRLTPDDAVLVSGGGRGVGFAFACELARRVGCRVVVTGRSALPTGEAWLGMDGDEYAAWCRERMRASGPGRVGAVRREHVRFDALRDLAANLRAVEAEGLPVEYRACDFLDPGQVQHLVDELGDDLRVVVHNAGIAAPTRLRAKSADTVVRVVESKLVAFVNLVEAVRGRRLDYVCNVGSVAGRMGGMAGQIDYAGANEVLARLGFWAQERLGLPVATLCWTTWERVGLIANYEAALRYGSALRVEEGVTRWVDEVLAAEPTESMFLGRVGTALAPTQIRGFLKFADHPDLPWLLSRHHYLGDVERYVPFSTIRARNRLARASQPCLAEVEVDGCPALPVSVALEYAVSAGDWVPPEGWPLVHLQEVRDLEIDLTALRQTSSTVQLVTEATAGRRGPDWVVDVSLSVGPGLTDRGATGGGSTVGLRALSTTLVYRDEVPAPGQHVRPPAGGTPAALPAAPGLRWLAVVHRPPQWHTADATLVAAVRASPQADAWTVPQPPSAVLPSAALEAVVQGIARTGPAGGRRLVVDRLSLAHSGGAEAVVVGDPEHGEWSVADAEGRLLLRLDGARLV